MTRIGHDGQGGARPGGRQVERAAGRADHVVAALHDLAGEMGDPVHAGQQPLRRQEQPVVEVVRLDPGQPERRPVAREIRHRTADRQKGRAGALVAGPGARRRHMHRRVGIQQPGQVGAQQVAALRFRHMAGEGGMGIGKHRPQPVEEPVELQRAAEEDATQHHAGDPLRMRLRVRQRQGRTPGAAEQHPALDVERGPQTLDVGDQGRGVVGAQAALRLGASGTALVEDHDPPVLGIEETPVHRAGAGTGPAMQEQDRLSGLVSGLLPIHQMRGVAPRPGTNRFLEREVAGGEGFDFRKQVAACHDAL